MDSWDVRAIGASYSTEDDVPVIEIFGRTSDGHSITVRYRGFFPYFYLSEPPDDAVEKVKKEEEYMDSEWVELDVPTPTMLVKRKALKVITRHPWKVPELRKRYSRYCEVLASDIPFAKRFIYDMNLGSSFRVSGEEVKPEGYTTDIVVEAEAFENIDPIKPDFKYLSFDIENSIETKEIYTIGVVIEFKGETRKLHFRGEEKEILHDFIELVKKEDPDIITGYNIGGYDIPMIAERMEHHKMGKPQLGRDGSSISAINERFWRCHGRIIADAWWAVKKEVRPKKETLGHVAELLLGEEKDDVNPKLMDQEWKDDPEKVVKYCIQDAYLALRILRKIDSVEKAMDLATVSKLPVDDALNGNTSAMIDSILIRESDRRKIGVPQMKFKSREGGKIEGGYVHSIKPGVYHWVIVLDFKSMYPSTIISKNICFTTLHPEGEIVSPIGVRFLSPDKRKGILPEILENLMRERDETKRKMREAKTDDDRRYYDGLQAAIKVLMNSFYGVFASSFYRFTNKNIGASITAFSRENIKTVIEKLEAKGYNVIYSDTDSVFFQSPEKGLDAAIRVGKEVSEEFSRGGLMLEFEKVINPLFSHGAKKRYVGKVVWPKEDLIIRGYEIRRTDSFDLQSRALLDIFELVLAGKTEEAVKSARETVERVATGKVPLNELVISRTCKPFNQYKEPDSMANVQAARKMTEKGYEFVPGMKVSWIVTNSKRTPQEVEPYIDGEEFTARPDWNYYARRLASTLARVTEVFGWDEDALMRGIGQATLFDSFGTGARTEENTDSPKKERKSRIKNNVTLDDFM